MSFPEHLAPAERELMQQALPVWREFHNKGYSLPGNLLAIQYAFVKGWQRRDSEDNNAATGRGKSMANNGFNRVPCGGAGLGAEKKTAPAPALTETRAYVTQEGNSR